MDRAEPTTSMRALVGGESWILRRTNRIAPTMTTSPRKTYRQVAKVVTAPPISGPAATAMAPAAATMPYAPARRSRGKLAATRETIAGMIRAAPIPSSRDQPRSRTARLGASAVVSEPAP
jgi:hypothetical protein